MNNIVYYGYTDCGIMREINQDALLMKAEGDGGIFVVADGMGGHSHGEVASSLIVDRVSAWSESRLFGEKAIKNFDELLDSLENLIESINIELVEDYSTDGVCGSTLVAILVKGGKYAIFSVGDSRIYIRSGREFLQMTQDHVWQNQSDVAGSMTPKELKNHPNYGKLTNAMGADSHIKISISTGSINEGDTFTLCSDGIYKCFKDTELARILKGLNPRKGVKNYESLAQKIRRLVNKKGSPDNHTLIFVGVGN